MRTVSIKRLVKNKKMWPKISLLSFPDVLVSRYAPVALCKGQIACFILISDWSIQTKSHADKRRYMRVMLSAHDLILNPDLTLFGAWLSEIWVRNYA